MASLAPEGANRGIIPSGRLGTSGLILGSESRHVQDQDAAGTQRPGQRLHLRVDADQEMVMAVEERHHLPLLGQVVPLEDIAREGFLSAAARAMGMSFSHVWNLVEYMNCLAGQPLVDKQAGGPGARLTPAGEQAVADFWRLVREFQVWMSSRKPSSARPLSGAGRRRCRPPAVPLRPSPKAPPPALRAWPRPGRRLPPRTNARVAKAGPRRRWPSPG